MISLPNDDFQFLLDLANGNDTNGSEDFNRLDQIRSALADIDLSDGVTVVGPEGTAWLLSSRNLDGNDTPVRVFTEEWQIDLVINIGGEVDPNGLGPKMIKTELPTGLSIKIA